MTAFKPDRTLDCRSVIYPVPILKAEKALVDMADGQVLEVQATDANVKPDLVTWAALMYASIACAMAQDVVVYCVQEGPM